MARTKQTARKSTGGKAPRKAKPDNFTHGGFNNNPFGSQPFGGGQFTPFGQGAAPFVNPREYEHDFDDFSVDVLGEEEDASGSDLDFNNDATTDRDHQGKPESTPFLFFDFRRGATQWPTGAHLVDSKEADQLLKTAKEAAEKTDDKEDDSDGDVYMDSETIIYEEKDETKTQSEQEEGVAPADAKFETLKDGSTALIIPAGTRLRLDLKNLLNGQWDKKKKKKTGIKKKPKKPEPESKGEDPLQRQVGFDWMASLKAMRGRKYGPYAPEGYGSYSGYGSYRRKYKEYLDAYTITMDVKFLDEFPRDGVSLMQTALIHSEENVKASRKKLIQSEGECVVTRQGGVGTLGTFGDVSKAKVERNKWTRIVMTVNCSAGDDEKGEFRTFINASPCATIKSEAITSRGRFSIDPETFFLFSSKQNSMMPGSIALRAVRVENVFSDEAAVKAWRARDKVISVFEEDRKTEIDQQRQGLALSELFPKPRPIWLAPTMIGLFGDPFIQGTPLEGSSLLPWSFSVLNFALQRMLQEQGDFLEGLNDEVRGAISDVMHIMDQSDEVFKQMMKLLKYPNESQLMAFLRRLRTLMQDVNVGESLLIPLLVERKEMILLMERTNEQAYRFVIVQTDPTALDYHVSTAQSPPKIKYRTCMVLSGVPKKNALDDVFWLAVFNLALHSHQGDINRFYSVLVPFLTNQTLESSMVESSEMAAKGELGWEGDFKAPQRSETSYVRCVWHCMNYLLRKRGLTKQHIKRVQVALRMQFVCFIKNDIKHVFPNENGRLICNMACSQLAYAAAKLIRPGGDSVKQKESKSTPLSEIKENGSSSIDSTSSSSSSSTGNSSSSSTSSTSSSSSNTDSKVESVSMQDDESHLESVALNKVRKIVDEIRESLEASAEQSSSPIPLLDLTGKRPEGGTDDPALCQYRDALAWEVPDGDPDPGQPIFLSKYVPIDILQMPVKASTRQEAVMAISLCDRLCTLMDNQSHTVKNDKFLIFSLIQQLFTQILPMPKPRDSQLSAAAQWKARRGERRKKRAAKKKLGGSEAKATVVPEREMSEVESEVEMKAAEEEEDTSQPSWRRGLESEAASVKQKCIWDQPIHYELQMEMMMTVQRLMEHFAAAALSLSHNRAFDAVCIIVTGCMAAVADSLMRRRATDRPSEVCSHLMGQSRDGRQLGLYGFGISVAGFAQQTETIEIHSPELHIARTAVLDYFQSPQQRKLAKIFTWENSHILKPGRPLIKYLRNVCKEIALVMVQQPVNLLCDSLPMCSMLMLNYPELKAYRDICFWWKFFLNPDLNVFPNTQEHIQRRDRMTAQLVWAWEGGNGGYQVHSLNGELQMMCRPDPNVVSPVTGKVLKESEIPTCRYPSTASPSFYVSKPEIRTEDDVVYRHNLPNFAGKYGPLLGQRDSELLISYLTVPYLRVPLVMTFFATEDRVHKLRSKRMRGILDAVLFEPGKYQSVLMCGVEPVMVPTAHPQLLATPYGLLLNELCRSPDTIIRSTVAIVRSALALDTGSVCDENANDFNTSVDIILYVCRLAARVENYISFLIQHTLGTHPCVDVPLRDMEVTPECLERLQKGLVEVRGYLHTDFVGLFNDYLQRLDDQCRKDPKNEVLIDRNSRLSSDLHTHKLIMLRNLSYDDLTPHYVTTFIGSFVYLTTRHTWNKSRKANQIMIPEHELYELLAVQRVRLVKWIRARVQSQLDEIMQTSLQVATSSTGSMRASEFVDEQNRWSRIQGPRSVGRYAVGSSRTVASANPADAEAPPPSLVRQRSITSQVSEVPDDGLLGVEIDLQIGQMTLRSRHLSALESDIANHPDVKLIFGDSTMQASLLEKAEHRHCIRLVGLNHDLEHWGRHGQSPPLDEQWERPYDPSEMFENEQWIVRLFEPVRRAFYNGPNPPPMQFMLPEKALPESAEVAVIVGLHQGLGGPFKLVYVFKRLRCLHVYEVLSHGRQWWWSLHLTTDARYTLRELQPSYADRAQPFPDWWENGAGAPYPGGVTNSIHNNASGMTQGLADHSVVIIRDFNHHDNLSGGREIFIPERLLYGLIPNALFENFLFWQDESKGPPGSGPLPGYRRLRGYPTDADNDHMIFIELFLVGSWKDLARGLSTTVECTGLPGRSVQVTRVSKARVIKEFRSRQQIASTLEVNHLLAPPPKPKRSNQKAEDKDTSGELKVGSRVEVYRQDSGEHWPATITAMNDNETIDVKFTGDYEWAGSGSYSPEHVQPRGSAKNQNQGENIWHWAGMTDSEDQDWASTSDDEEEKVEQRKERQRITYSQMNDLGFVLAAADNNETLCLEILNELKVVQPFTAVGDLVTAMRDLSKFKQASLDAAPDTMVLLNLLYAPRRSRLFSLAKVLSRVENLSYICAWTYAVKPNNLPFECDRDCPPIDLVELPRLKLAFTARMDPDKQMRLYSMDHADLFISNERPPLSTQLLQGLPHALLLSNLQGELKVLVPVIEPSRPAVGSEPFSTRLVLNRSNKAWSDSLVQRYFLYTVHISLSFLLTQGLSTALYLMLLRFLHRDYEEVFRLSDSVATDTAFTAEANMIFQAMLAANNDSHPDAHACRAKVTLGIIDSGAHLPWDLTQECARYIVKLSHISANCRISLNEELQLLQCDRIVIDEDSEQAHLHSPYVRMLVKNRLHHLQTLLGPETTNQASCWLPPRSSDGNWLVYSDSTVFGEKYRELVEIDSVQKWEETLAAPGLVLAIFHVFWNEASKKCLAAVRDLCPSYPYVTFASVRADARPLSALARSQAETFPTFVLFRDGKEVPSGRVSGGFQVLERVVQILQQITVKDKAAWANAQRKDEGGEEEQEEDLLWTWNSEHCGASLRVEDLGMTVKLAMGEEEEEDDVVWEKKDIFSFGQNYEPLPVEVSAAIEREYQKGSLYTDMMAINIPSYHIEYQGQNFGNRFEITDRLVTGLSGTDNRGERVNFQRRGTRRIVPNEPEVSEEQKRKDKRTLSLQLRKAALRQKMLQEKVGKDTEAICGTMGFAQGTGMYKWTLQWNHEPTRKGLADGLGVCVPNKTQFGPMRDPVLGDTGDGGASVALYASGALLHKGATLSQVAPRRGKIEPTKASESEATPQTGESSTSSFRGFADSAPATTASPFGGPATTASPFGGFGSSAPSSGFAFGATPSSFGTPAPKKGASTKTVSFATNLGNPPAPASFAFGGSASPFGATPTPFGASPFGGFGGPAPAFGGGFGGGGGFGASSASTGFNFGNNNAGENEEDKPVTDDKVTPVDEQAPCWGKGQRVTCILDTDTNGGSLSFQVDDDLLDVQVTDIFALLSTSIVYPSVCLAPPALPFPATATTTSAVVPGKADDDEEKASEELFQRGLAVGLAAGMLERGNVEAFRGIIEGKEREIQKRLAPSITICGPKPVKPVEVKEKPDANDDDDDAAEEEEEKAGPPTASKHSQEDETVGVDRVVWMWEEQEKGWQKFSPEISRQLEVARRDGKSKYSLRRDEEQLVFKLLGEISVIGDDGEEKKMRRHVVGEGLSAQWEIMSVKYAPPVSMRGIQVLQTLERVWAHPETMDGSQCQLGFLFLYSLLQGQTRCKVFSSYYSSYGYGGYGYGGGDSGGSDAARFALLLAQLYNDVQSKSVAASIVDTLNRNRQLCMRMPRFKDTRKVKQTPIFNGWKDEREPKSPLAELFSSVVPIMQSLKKKRGAIIFPPKPPYPELSPPKDTVEVVRRLSETENRDLMRPTFSDYACDSRSLSEVSSEAIMKLATHVGEPLRSPNALQAKPPLTVNSEKHFQSLMVDAATAEGGPRLVIVIFFATWSAPCTALSPLVRTLALKTPTAQFLRVDVDDCDALAKEYGVRQLPVVQFMRGGSAKEHIAVKLTGYSEEFLSHFLQGLTKCTNANDAKMLQKGQSWVAEFGTSRSEMEAFASRPLYKLDSFLSFKTRSQQGYAPIRNKLPFHIEGHPDANTSVARSMLTRMEDDIATWAKTAAETPIPKIVSLSDAELASCFGTEPSADVALKAAHDIIEKLIGELKKIRDDDAAVVQGTIPLIVKASNWLGDGGLDRSKKEFLLRRQSGQEPLIWLQFVFGVLLSSRSEHDLCRLNPFLSPATVQLVFNLATATVLRSNRVGQANRCIAASVKLLNLLDRVISLSSEERQAKRSTLLPTLVQAGEDLAENVACGRYFIRTVDKDLVFDPRFLIFEFTWNIILRKKQVEIVNEFLEDLRGGRSKVKQMIMGNGKTTVVAPLLALMLADGKSLVMSVVPRALVEMSRKRLRETFATIMQKRVYTLKAERSTSVNSGMFRSLQNAVRNRGIVVSTPTSVKSIMLLYIEHLGHIKQAYADGARLRHTQLKAQANELIKILNLFRDGVMLLDEVDLILHPLKSELNFPLGEKHDLDASEQGERWNLPMHLLDAVFFAEHKRVSTFEHKGVAVDILRRLTKVIEEGYNRRALQRLPHITVLNKLFYDAEIKPVMAEWAFLFLQKHHLHGIDRDEALRYVVEGATARSAATTKLQLIDMSLTEPSPNNKKRKVGGEAKNDAERLRLQEARAVASRQKDMINEICQLDADLDLKMKEDAAAVAAIQKQISDTTARIEELEFPRDDSLDNAIVLWYSVCFDGAKAETQVGGPMGPLLGKLEDSGLKVWTCSDAEDAIDRARQLLLSGRLRCVVTGGGENAGCQQGCTREHPGQSCLTCGVIYEMHRNHGTDGTCPTNFGGFGRQPQGGAFRGRPSFALVQQGSQTAADDYLKVLTELTVPGSLFAKKHSSIPASRAAFFCNGMVLRETFRMKCWQSSMSIIENEEALEQWIAGIEEWPVKEEAKKEIKEDDEPPSEAPNLNRQVSAGTTEIQRLRIQVDKLENDKMKFQEKKAEEVKVAKANLATKYGELCVSIEECRSKLEEVANKVKKLASLQAEPPKPGQRCGPISGRDAALALAWLDENVFNAEEKQPLNKAQISKCLRLLADERKYLAQTALAAKVVTHVSMAQKKLLNLTHDWLQCFMPHCLSKVNRVSFGLLNAEDCAEALRNDPHMPRSRLKLAVPFVGKDVPSQSSEFAHPDVIIGLTVLAYRYSGLRPDDFMDIIDSLTATFTQEIGPARDRPSSRRHELWVGEAGGSIRGLKKDPTTALHIESKDDSKRRKMETDSADTTNANTTVATNPETEVVQLKYLQKSNQEQMDKLFALWKMEPLCIHYYLAKTIFPTNMRAQRVKISASGQAVGGSMLVGRRVGFSGTPSDLLPKELGRCSYEDGDDGKMLTTVLDPDITSSETLPVSWNVDFLLEKIATAENPRYHALIDTGALVTGYMNKQVAATLLKRGLSWCDGVAFLDDQDKLQVLVRATGRVVDADQCGIPLERRFAFYDQIHTTGMDIKHVVNAKAVITLGKDMVFRDYVQGVFRMRGVGAGQTVVAWIIPEVAELFHRELRKASQESDTWYARINEHADDENRRTLVDIAAGLVLNSMKSEQVQWNMLCVQNVSNIYRKNAFARIQRAPELLDGVPPEKMDVTDSTGITSLQAQTCLDLFHETVDFSLDSAVPDPVPFSDKLRGLLEHHSSFILTPAEHDVGKSVLLEVGEHALLDEAPARLDTEQEQEQEQEQEKEVKSRKDQQIEVEKFVDREYSRMEEAPRSWHISMLGEQPMRPGTVMGSDSGDHPFYSMRDFRLRHQDPLVFPTPVHLSRNYFDPNWTGLRRVKNVVMLLEWAPALHDIQLMSAAEHESGPMTESQLVDLHKSYNLLRFHGMEAKLPGLTGEDVVNAVQAATDAHLTEEELASIMTEFGETVERQGKRTRPECITIEGFTRLLRTGRLRPEHKGRMWVAVSLAEAETIRRVMHLRQNRPLLKGKDTEIALRYSPMSSPGAPLAGDSGVIFDTSAGWKKGTGATAYQASVAHNCMRFFDADMYYPEAAINVLVRALQANKCSERERFFLANIGCRRRLERRWQDTPLARALTLPDEWAAFKQRVHTVFVREAIQSRQLTIWEAFTVFDADNNGMLSPAEVFGAMRWLGVPDCTAEDVVDFINAWDTNQDGMIEYNEYLEIWRDSNVQLHESEEDAGQRRNLPGKIEPYGDQELREVMHRRKSDELLHKREEKVRRDLYQASFDTKLFAEELEASKNRKGGANPLVADNTDGVRVIEYRFTSKQLPLRTVTRGTAEMVPMRGRSSRKRLEDKAMKCPQGHSLSQSLGRRYPARPCDLCNRSAPQWRCEMDCEWDVCNRCQEQWKEERASKQEEGGETTYLSCNAGASFTVQVPSSAIFAAVPTALDLLTFTVTIELMVAKLPTQRAALLRFSSPEHTRSRRQYSSNVYLNRDGVVQGPTAKPDASITPQAVVPKKWHVVSVSVNCKAGVLLVYVDGKLSGREEYTDSQELKLQDKLTVLGGGKQAESCGGNIRRVLIHEATLGPEKILQLSMEAHKQMIGKRYVVCCEVDLGYVAGVERTNAVLQPFLQEIVSKLGNEFELKYYMQTQDDEALATIIRDPSRVYCAMVALTPAGPRPKKQLNPSRGLLESFGGRSFGGFGASWNNPFGQQQQQQQAVEEEDEQKIASALAKSFRDCSSSLPLFIFSTDVFKPEEKDEEGTIVVKSKKEKKEKKDVEMKPVENNGSKQEETDGGENKEVADDNEEGEGDESEEFWKAETKQACPPAQWPKTPAELSEMVQGAVAVDRTEAASEEDGEKGEEEEQPHQPIRAATKQPFYGGGFGRGKPPNSQFSFPSSSGFAFGNSRGGMRGGMTKTQPFRF